MRIVIATRESRLALWQAEHVQSLLTGLGHAVELLGMTTRGDQILDRSLSKVGGKGLFVKELEVALDEGRADIAVHSLKDVPMDLPDGFVLACVLEREDPRDAFVSNRYASLDAVPDGGVIGTSSLRRTVLLRALRPDLRIEPLRGNLDTRLRKLDEGHFDGIVLAAAGLTRLGLAGRIRTAFDPVAMRPAAGQGALGIEVRADRPELIAALAPLAHAPTWQAVTAERAVSRAMGGSCSMPLAAHALWDGSELQLDAAWGETEVPGPLVTASARAVVTDLASADALGLQVVAGLRAGRRALSGTGMQVIVTRPQQDALRWVEAMQGRGLRAEALPLIDIRTATDAEPARQAWERFAQYRAAMFVSGNAVQHFHALKPTLAKETPGPAAINTRAWATGPGTLAALLQAGVAPSLIDAPAMSSGQFDSEALWQIVGPGVAAGSRVLIVRGGAPGGEGMGRSWFAKQLEAAGALVDFVVAYERHPPHWTAAQAARAQAATQDGSVWLLSSSEAIAHLRQRLPASALGGARAVATHPRIAQAAQEAGFGVVCESRPTLDDVVASIESLA